MLIKSTQENDTSDRKILFSKCHVCTKDFNQYELESHYLTAHGQIKSEELKKETKDFKCNFCDSLHKNISSLRYHRWRQHTRKKTQYSCEICNKIFTSRYNRLSRALPGGHRLDISGQSKYKMIPPPLQLSDTR